MAPSEVSRTCFLICPIGNNGTTTRERSDTVRDFVVTPAVEPHGLSVVRAEKLERPGYVTHHIVDALRAAPLVVADLSERNPNVYYELGVRHTVGLPTLLIAPIGEPLPADLVHQRVTFYNVSDPRELSAAVAELNSLARAALDGDFVSPIDVAAVTSRLSEGSASDAALAEILQAVGEVRGLLGHAEEGVPQRRARLLRELETETFASLLLLAEIEELEPPARATFGALVDSARKLLQEYGDADTRRRIARAMSDARKAHEAAHRGNEQT